MQKGSPSVIGEMNRNLVFTLILKRMPISRKEIANISGLSTAAVSKITAALMERGLIYEVGEQIQESAGRRSILLRINPSAGFVVGVKMAERAITSVIADLEANVRHFQQKDLSGIGLRSAPDKPIDPQVFLSHVIQCIESTISNSGINHEQIMGIGIGINGLVDTNAGISVMAPHFGWHNVEVASVLNRHFNSPVVLENDIRTLTIAEKLFGHGRGVDNFATVGIGFGIGAGLVVNGQIVRGFEGGAGEFGHIIVQPGGPPCSCGKRGCLESLTSEAAIVRRANEQSTDNRQFTSLVQITDAANAGDRLSQGILAEAGHWLGIGLASLINILNPQLIVVAGESVYAGSWLLESMQRTIQTNSFAGMADRLQLVVEQSGTETWAHGAACLVLSHLFASPLERASNQIIQSLGAK